MNPHVFIIQLQQALWFSGPVSSVCSVCSHAWVVLFARVLGSFKANLQHLSTLFISFSRCPDAVK